MKISLNLIAIAATVATIVSVEALPQSYGSTSPAYGTEPVTTQSPAINSVSANEEASTAQYGSSIPPQKEPCKKGENVESTNVIESAPEAQTLTPTNVAYETSETPSSPADEGYETSETPSSTADEVQAIETQDSTPCGEQQEGNQAVATPNSSVNSNSAEQEPCKTEEVEPIESVTAAPTPVSESSPCSESGVQSKESVAESTALYEFAPSSVETGVSPLNIAEETIAATEAPTYANDAALDSSAYSDMGTLNQTSAAGKMGGSFIALIAVVGAGLVAI